MAWMSLKGASFVFIIVVLVSMGGDLKCPFRLGQARAALRPFLAKRDCWASHLLQFSALSVQGACRRWRV